jgi:predicted SprT family Zn-dependent metalloprotease
MSLEILSMTDIEQLSSWALNEFGLTDSGWTFSWDRAVRRAGCCHFSTRRITISFPIFSIEVNREHVLDTILHEVAHALAGHRAGHGPDWKAVALQLGARPERCHQLEVPRRVLGTCACEGRHWRAWAPVSVTHRCRTCVTAIVWSR